MTKRRLTAFLAELCLVLYNHHLEISDDTPRLPPSPPKKENFPKESFLVSPGCCSRPRT